jgi:hypothetical protein
MVPVIKDRTKKINCKNNYRPIALASVISKVVEHILFDRIQDYLTTLDNQFGFKQRQGTDVCIYVMKEIIDRYQDLDGCIYMCFLDASKAFDRINHTILFRKLINRGVPPYIVRILSYWYCSQTMYIRWGNSISEKFTVSNGVRQGGILSPHLFNVYVDNLSVDLCAHQVGCTIGHKVVNHLMYADDLVLFASSATGLQILINECQVYGSTHDIKYNSTKSAVMVIKNKYLKGVSNPNFYLDNELVKNVDHIRYLGHVISANTKDDMDIMRQCRSLYIQCNVLVRKFHMCSDRVKKTLFTASCYPLYTTQLWRHYSTSVLYTFTNLRLHTTMPLG